MRGTLIQRALWWLVGIALPATPLLRVRMAHAIRGVMFAVIAGVLFSGLLIGGFGVLFHYMTLQGISFLVAAGAVGGIAGLVGLYALWKALAHITVASSVKDDLALFAGVNPVAPIPMAPTTIGGAFLSGLMTPAAPVSRYADTDIPVMDRLHPGRVESLYTASAAPGQGAAYHAGRATRAAASSSFY